MGNQVTRRKKSKTHAKSVHGAGPDQRSQNVCNNHTDIGEGSRTMNQTNVKPQTNVQKDDRQNAPSQGRNAAPVEGSNLNEKYMWLDNKVLQISPDIQRQIDPMRVGEIVANFSPMVANPIKVSYREGKYFIFDGMHTRTAIRELNGTDDFPIYCRVYFGLTKEDEARLFAAQFGASEAVPMAYRLRARAVGKDPEVLDFLKVTRDSGFSITLGKSVPGNGRIAAACAAFKMFRDLGSDIYGRMLTILHRTWAGESWSVSRNMLCGMARFMKMYSFQEQSFVKALRGVTRREVVTRADQYPGMTRDGAFAAALADLFDRNSTSALWTIS